MTEATGKNVVSLLEEHVDLAISTVKKLRDEKLELEAEIARLNSDVLQRNAKIQELENLNSDLREASELARLATEEERAGIRQQLEGLMAGLVEPDVTSEATDATASNSEDEVLFKAQSKE
ncbi:hypothetical protein J4G08_21810 [Candidatus Poribacteria bacterium]|nr:hypothetical protein [Candidatus Poribacteria bacterium]